MIARDVVVDEGSMFKCNNMHNENSQNDFDNVNQNKESSIIEDGESAASLMEGEGVPSISEVKILEKSTNLNNADPVEIGDELKEDTVKKEIRRSERIKYKPKLSYRFLEKCLMNTQVCLNDIPNTFDEIEFREDKIQWRNAIVDELKSHSQNNTWCIVPKPKNKNIADCKWVSSIKQDEFGNLVKYKARLVARGFTQEYMTDYEETFAAVAMC